MEKLDTGLQLLLAADGWTFLQLESAFDSLPEAINLVTGLSDNHEPYRISRKWGRDLMLWQADNAERASRGRARIARADPFARATVLLRIELAAHPLPCTSTPASVSTLCIGSTPTVWKTRRSAKLFAAGGADERQRIEDKEKARWTEKIVGILRDANAPILALAELTSNPQLAILAVVGRKRSKTLRGRVRTWVRVRVWLQCVHSVEYPAHLGHMIDFLADLEGGPCPKSLPTAVDLALAFFEKCGGFAEKDCISSQPLWKLTVANLTCRLQERAGNLSTKKAPQYAISMLISLELKVCSKDQKFYVRVLAWCKLLKNWMVLRWDDLQGLSRSRTTLTRWCLRSVLGRSKTTGPGKRTGEVPCFVRTDCSFSGLDWLGIGFDLFVHCPCGERVDRDFFLPAPTSDLTGFSSRMLEYDYASALSRMLLLDLFTPVRDSSGVWTESTTKLIRPPAQLFWSEHSPRHLVPSVTAVLGLPKDSRDVCGRWGINSARQSSDYVLTARQIILDVQRVMMERICRGPSAYDEQDLWDDFRSWLNARDSELDPEPQIENLAILIDVASGCSLDQTWPVKLPTIAVVIDDDDGFDNVATEDNIPADTLPDGLLAASSVRIQQDLDAPFWASIGKRGFSRLHRNFGCSTDRHSCREWISLTFEQGSERKSDRACHLCWPDLRPKNFANDADDSSNLDSSDESSSSGESLGSTGFAEANELMT